MARPSRFGCQSLIAFFLLILLLLNITVASPLSIDHVGKSLTRRDPDTLITKKQYLEYCRKYFPETDRYLFYSGGSGKQVEEFKAKNEGYYSYDDIFNAHTPDHPWYKFFDGSKHLDDGEVSSKVMATLASGDVLVFGAVDSEQEGPNSFYVRHEVRKLRKGLQNGRIRSINHMAKYATSPSQVIAKEDASGQLTWVNGHKEGEKNASMDEAICKKRDICDPRTPNAKNMCG